MFDLLTILKNKNKDTRSHKDYLLNIGFSYAVYAGSVESSKRKVAFELLESQILPAFVKWVKRIIDLPDNSPILACNPTFEATLVNENSKFLRIDSS